MVKLSVSVPAARKPVAPTVALPRVTFPSAAAANGAARKAGLSVFTTKVDNKGGWYFEPGTGNDAPKTFGKAIVTAGKHATAPTAPTPPKGALAKALADSVKGKAPKAPAKAPTAAKAPVVPPKGKGGRVLPVAALGGKAPEPKAPKKTGQPLARADWAKAYDTNTHRAAAMRGTLPPVPDFSADTHAGYRGKLAEVVAMVEAGDVDGLLANDIEPKSSSRSAICRYRDIAIVALQAKAAQKLARTDKKAAKAAAPAKAPKGKGKPASQPQA